VRIGQTEPAGANAAQPPNAPDVTFTLTGLGAALRSVTPTLIVVGIFTGAAFALGSGIVGRYVLSDRRPRSKRR
jgi:hypothetical protein